MGERNAAEIVRMDLDAIYIGNLNTVDGDLVLPGQGKYGSRLEWATGEDRFIQKDGTVHQPLHGMGNRQVVLTVTASYAEYSSQREFSATVLQKAKKNIITAIRTVAVTAKPGKKAALPSVVIADTADGRRMTLPVRWEKYVPSTEEGGSVLVNGAVSGYEKMAQAKIDYRRESEKAETSGKKREKKIHFFPQNQVRLLAGTLYYEYQQRMIEYLLSVDEDQMLYNFRKAAGLDTCGAKPMSGWDAAECKLKGHTSGHYLSGLALAWSATGNPRFLEKIEVMTEGLSKCQEAFEKTGKYHRGFLSGYTEEQFDLLEQFTRYPEIWAPYYTLDKIMSGLYDCYMLAGNKTAEHVLDALGDWVYERLSRLSKETLDQMWSMYIAGEFGGMLGTMVKLYQISGKESHLQAARLFVNEKLFYPMEQNCDTLEDMHANQHIPQIMGAVNLFEATGEETYWKIAEHFWEIVTGGHTYCIGGVGETEMFHRTGSTCSYLTEKAAESCASYNLLRLTAQLFTYTGNGRMMDYYENTLRNHILTSCSHTADGGTTYFMPLGPGEVKEYSTTENTCCHGTGMESRFRYMEDIYAYDDESVYVNLLIDSKLTGESAMEQRSQEEAGKVTIRCLANMKKKLKIHIPSWTNGKFRVFINGNELKDAKPDDGYLCLSEHLYKEDTVLLEFPMELRILENAFDHSFVNLAFGPYILAALSDSREFLKAPALKEMKAVDGEFRFRADGTDYIPLPQVDHEAYHVYFKREK